jgi:choline/carnitine/betaine transport
VEDEAMAVGHRREERRDLTEAERRLKEAEAAGRRARRAAIYNRARFRGLQIDPETDFYPEVAHRRPGDTNVARWGFDLHPWVAFISSGLLVTFVAVTLVFSAGAEAIFGAVLEAINAGFGWFYILTANLLVLAAVFFAFGRYGKIRIGGPNAKPEFSRNAWYAMLISAGMGIGLMFWSVAEPIFHLNDPAPLFGVEPGSSEAGNAALATTFYHWGLHPWSIYALVALALSFFAYNRGLPLTFRSVFYPLLGPRIYGGWGNAIDILTVLATLAGLATSLGFGVGQAAARLNFLFGWPETTGFQVFLIAAITGVAVISVVAGLDHGVKRLSQLNIVLAGLFMAFLLVVGPALFILPAFVQGVGFYVSALPELAFWNEAFADTDWQGGWTVFYWGWWISWSPFVGMFIARVSKGRTVRELILGVVVFPSMLSFFWMSVFGGTALDLQLTGGRDVAAAVSDNVATATFDMLQAFPWAPATSFVGVVLVVSFFVTSADSGSLVIDHLTSGGKLESPSSQRVFWAAMVGVLAAVLLLGGGLAALQTAAVATGLPFAVVLLVLCWSLQRAFHEELDLLEAHYDAAIFRSRHGSLLEHLDREAAQARGPSTPDVAAGEERFDLLRGGGQEQLDLLEGGDEVTRDRHAEGPPDEA